MLAAINTFTNETRKADYFILPAPDASKAAAPADGRDPVFLRLAQGQLSHARIRKVNVLVVTPAEIAKSLTDFRRRRADRFTTATSRNAFRRRKSAPCRK